MKKKVKQKPGVEEARNRVLEAEQVAAVYDKVNDAVLEAVKEGLLIMEMENFRKLYLHRDLFIRAEKGTLTEKTNYHLMRRALEVNSLLRRASVLVAESQRTQRGLPASELGLEP